MQLHLILWRQELLKDWLKKYKNKFLHSKLTFGVLFCLYNLNKIAYFNLSFLNNLMKVHEIIALMLKK